MKLSAIYDCFREIPKQTWTGSDKVLSALGLHWNLWEESSLLIQAQHVLRLSRTTLSYTCLLCYIVRGLCSFKTDNAGSGFKNTYVIHKFRLVWSVPISLKTSIDFTSTFLTLESSHIALNNYEFQGPFSKNLT